MQAVLVKQNEPFKKLNILVLCTGNSARSIMAEALFNRVGGAYFQAWSAGSHPTGRVNPFALEKIASLGYFAKDVSSQSWHVYEQDDAPQFDIVMTVCGNAANENCPVFQGEWSHVHWGLPDPANSKASEDESRLAFSQCFDTLNQRIQHVVNKISALTPEPDFRLYRHQVLSYLEQEAG